MSTFIPKDMGLHSVVLASDLAAKMMGSVLSFAYRMPTSKVRLQVIGELRQVSWGGGTVSVLVCSHDQDGGGSLEEFELNEDHEITFLEAL